VCDSSKKSKGEVIFMGNYNNFRQSICWHEQQVERKKREFGAEASIEGEFYRMLKNFWRISKMKIEDPCFHP
jgi:hypothetical protein